jgi:hypothetical protein
MSEGSRLAVLVDGALLDEEAGRALWVEFSAHMEANRGDMAGFAKLKGWTSVAPEYRQGKAVLVVRTGAAVAASAEPKRSAAPASAEPRRRAAPASGAPKGKRKKGAPGKGRR